MTQLIEVLDTIGSQLDIGKQIDVIYLDMSKEFDKVSHVRLLHRLREFGFGGNLLMWLNSYLKNRRQHYCSRCNIDSTTSDIRSTARFHSWPATFPLIYQ